MCLMMSEDNQSQLYEKLSQELRRGLLILATLSQLNEARYGYALISQLAERGLEIDQGTLYPLLRRLESQGLLESSWNVSGSRPRRYYSISAQGKAMLERLQMDWRTLSAVMDNLLTNSQSESR